MSHQCPATKRHLKNMDDNYKTKNISRVIPVFEYF
jgi:hypothetical protein